MLKKILLSTISIRGLIVLITTILFIVIFIYTMKDNNKKLDSLNLKLAYNSEDYFKDRDEVKNIVNIERQNLSLSLQKI